MEPQTLLESEMNSYSLDAKGKHMRKEKKADPNLQIIHTFAKSSRNKTGASGSKITNKRKEDLFESDMDESFSGKVYSIFLTLFIYHFLISERPKKKHYRAASTVDDTDMECALIIGKERSIGTSFICQYCAHCVPKELSTISFLSLSNIDELTDKMTEYCDSDIDERSLFSSLFDLSQLSDSQEINEGDDREEEEPRRVLRPKKPIIYRTETPFKELGLFRRTHTKEKKKLPKTKNNIKKSSTNSDSVKETSTKRNDEADTIEYPDNLIHERGRIDKSDIQVHNCLLGEGQTSLVYKGKYKNLTIACKTGRIQCLKENEKKVKYELEFSNKLYTCRFINRYIGWTYCHPNEIMNKATMKKYTRSKFKPLPTIFVIQRYFPNRDGRTYFHNRGKNKVTKENVAYSLLGTNIHPHEILQIGICLFSALVDAHKLGIGFVDLKLENLLVNIVLYQSCAKLTLVLIDRFSRVCLSFRFRASIQ